MQLKIYLTSLFVALAFTVSLAQELPKEGAVIAMSETNFSLQPGASAEYDVQLLRSKRAKKTKFSGFEARTPEGIDINFVEKAEADSYSMKIDVAESAVEKSYTIVIKGAGNNGYKVKGKVISINVGNQEMVKSDG